MKWTDDNPGPGAGAVVALILLGVIVTCALLACVTVTVYGAPAAPLMMRQTDVPPTITVVTPRATSAPYPAPYPAPLATGAGTIITLRRIDAARAELCAPSENVFARSADGYRLAYDWPGGCAVIGASDRFGGEVYCVQTSPSPPAFMCSGPLPQWWRTVLYFPIMGRA